jgi:diguanylate cyclase (GGDEF)-like protein
MSEEDLDYTTALHSLEEPEEENKSKRQTVLIVMSGPTTGQTVFLESKSKWNLGRLNTCDIVFHDASVSRSHADITFDPPSKWYVEDLGSSNGTYVNGKRIHEKTVLTPGDKIQLGSTIITKFVLQDEVEAAFQRELYESATKDALTGLYSKRFFMDQLEIEFNYHSRIKKPLSLVMSDLDHFKKVNDTLGHLAGDFVLKECGKLYLSILRKGDLVGRYGGEEVIFMLRDTPIHGAKVFAERIRRMIESHSFIFDGKKINVTISLGVSTNIDESFQSPEALIKDADAYLYKAKQSGRNRVVSILDGI